MCLYLCPYQKKASLFIPDTMSFMNSHLKCNILHSSHKNVLFSAHLNKLFNYRIQQLKVQLSILCLVKAFAQMRSEVAHGPAVAMKIKNMESPRETK